MSLGKIVKLDLRYVWKHESIEFSKWLSRQENIEYLNDIIGLSLVDVQTEKNVGGYKCDIVCRDELTDKIVIIENQLESTDHDHLGKIITYASGLDASVIIWIVKIAREEHQSAIEWLNKHTDESISFFLIQIELISICDSPPAPQFKVIEAPNDYSKQMKKTIRETKSSESEIRRYEFWTAFNEVMNVRKEFNVRKASTDHWYDFSIGSGKCHLSTDLINKDGKIRVSLFISDNKELFDSLLENKEEIERSVGLSLDWERLDNKKASRICTYIEGFSFSKTSKYKDFSNSIIDILVRFKSTFREYLL